MTESLQDICSHPILECKESFPAVGHHKGKAKILTTLNKEELEVSLSAIASISKVTQIK